MMTWKFILIYLMLFIPTSALAQALIVTDNTPTLSAVPYLLILEDPGQQLTLKQATSSDTLKQFTPYADNLKNLELKDSAWWLRLDIQRENKPDSDWYAQFRVPLLTSESDTYFISDAHPVPVHLPDMQEKPGELRLYTVKLPELKKFTLIFRLNNHGDALIHFPLQLLDTGHLLKKIASDNFLYGGIIISLLVMATYNLFLFFSLRHYAYLTLVIYLLASILLVQKTTNVIPALSFLKDPTTFYHSFSTQLVLISGLQFWRQLFSSKKLFPQMDKVARYLLLFMIVSTPFISFLPFSSAWSLMMIAIVLTTITLFSLMAIKERLSAMFSFFLAFIATAICSLPITICSFGFFLDKVEVALDLFNLGALCATVLLSLTLAEHSRQLRIQAERAKTENKMKDRFLTTMSHELRTPMHTSASIIHLLKTTQLSSQQSKHISKLETSTNHMLELINDVLDLARSKSNELQLEKRPFRINNLLAELEQLIDEKARKKQLTLTIINRATTEQSLTGDAMRLKQTLLNLLDNAIKFTETGEVTLTITPCDNPENNTQTLAFSITDTGIGISKTQRKRIFEAFSQADSDTTRKYGGSGLGLAISSQLIKRMGGKLVLDSTIDRGSCFSFTLKFPVNTKPAEIPVYEEKITGPVPDNICILLVEDDSLNRMLGYELLTMMGFTCITASDGNDALSQLPQQKIDLIFMDISMPDMDGYETTRRIRAKPQYTYLPIIALTAHSLNDSEERYLLAGMNDYLCKPFAPEKLKEKALYWSGFNTIPAQQ